MKHSLLLASFRGYALVIIVLGLLAPLLILGGLRPVLTELELEDLTNTATALSGALAPSVISGDHAGADSIARSLGSGTGARITVISPDGRVLVDTEADPDSMESHRTRTEVISALVTGEGTAIRRSATLDRQTLYAAVLMEDDGVPVAVVRASMPFRYLESAVSGVALRMGILAATAILLSLLLAWIFSRSLSLPIGRLAESFERVRAGDFGVRAEPSRIRELDHLATGFNSAAARANDLISELSERNSQFRAIFDSASGPLAVLDLQGRFVIANGEFMRFGSSGGFEGRDYREVISSPELLSFLHRALQAPLGGRDRITAGGRSWTCAHTPVAGQDQVVVSLADITDVANLAAVKRDFAINVAHELRTPLTAIKGFAETLAGETEGPGRKYVDTILRNTERLISLVQDVQILSQIESSGYELDVRAVDLGPLVGTVLDLFRPAAAKKGLEILFEQDEIPAVRGDAFRLEQVLVNLVDNAVKYTERGSVTLKLTEDEGQALLEITDTGQGIPEADIPRLCERFYVVDRSRSRLLGGTGLGLAIVKHIVILHEGFLGIRSEPGRGSTFSVRLPFFETAARPDTILT